MIRRRWILLLVVLFPFAPSALAADGKISGSLETIDGVRVLRVWGKPYDRGFAHGRLLASDIVAMVGEVLLNPKVFPEIDGYESAVRQRMLPTMGLPRDRKTELEGVFAGIRDALPEEKLKLPRVDRALVLDDLVALNTFADWAGVGCSSFSVWGEMTDDGQTITARNLDYVPLPGLKSRQLIIAHVDAGTDRHSWVSVGWPGIVGAYTAMNSEGVTVSMHDAPGPPATDRGPFVPRSMALAEIMERVGATDAIGGAGGLPRRRAARDKHHVGAPFFGQDVPAAVFEYDSDRNNGHGVTRRTSADNGPGAPAFTVFCTNHYRKRAGPTSCPRFDKLKAALAESVDKHEKIDAQVARRIIAVAAQENTLHTVVFMPNARELDVSFADATHNGAAGRPAHFKLADLLAKP